MNKAFVLRGETTKNAKNTVDIDGYTVYWILILMILDLLVYNYYKILTESLASNPKIS